MAEADGPDNTRYTVVVNHEEQYSIWPVGREVPSGWRTVGVVGGKPECLAWIAEVWTDIRPRSVRQNDPAEVGSERGE